MSTLSLWMTQESGLLRAARLKKGFTQMEVAARAGVDIRLYQRLEYGQRSIVRASLKTGLAICFVLDLDPMELVFGVGYTAENLMRSKIAESRSAGR